MSLLRHADRNSMKWTVESRVPFLTIDFAEFLLTLPEEFLISNEGITKNIFRESMKDVVPDEILSRKDKIGFKTTDKISQQLIKDEFRNKVLKLASEIPFFEFDKLKLYFDELITEKRNFDPMTWRIINYIIWSDIFKIKFNHSE